MNNRKKRGPMKVPFSSNNNNKIRQSITKKKISHLHHRHGMMQLFVNINVNTALLFLFY